MVRQLPQKPHLLKIIPPLENSIVVKGDDIAWNNPWHYHPEIEILYCVKGKGTNFIGNCIRTIEEGELLLLGKNLPHTRQRDARYYQENPSEKPESVVIQFRDDFLGEQFFELREFGHIHKLLQRAKVGLKFYGSTLETVAQKLKGIKALNTTSAILELLSILDMLARSDEFDFLNAANYVSDAHEKYSQKINKVYHFTIEHFREPISLAHVASLTNHSPAAFCRYFKTRTRKSYFEYLTEIRIAYACERLMEGNLDVTQVCFASGFNNLSNFHKQFKKVMSLTPSEYRHRSLRKVPHFSS
ncbi:MAG TPA: AraC family transcriptional regulator [Chryseolinea sp.]|jgi:AraC-like DNA-binding protein|nr:AraC family transcriptional regulator [Chryseolinea sp.]